MLGYETGLPAGYTTKIRLFPSLIIHAEVSKWGRLRALPVADQASNKELPRSKFCEAFSELEISGTAKGHNGDPRRVHYKN